MLLMPLLFWGLSCCIAAVFGYLIDRKRGALDLLALMVMAGAIIFVVVFSLHGAGRLQLEHIADLEVADRPISYLTITRAIIDVAALGCATAGVLGYFLSQTPKILGAAMLVAAAVVGSIVCIVSVALAGDYGVQATVGALALSIIVNGTIGTLLLSTMFFSSRGVVALGTFWFGFAIAAVVGYIVAGEIGLALITLPAIALFWGGLYFVSGYSLPMDKEDGAAPLNANSHANAFRVLLTFFLQTNYPLYVIEDWKTSGRAKEQAPPPRVKGDFANQFFGGPGLIVTDPYHLAVTWNGGSQAKVKPPGVSFTGMFEQIHTAVDLRPQLRTLSIEAKTQDGIPVSIFTFMPHQIATGGEDVRLGAAFPYQEEAVAKAVFQTPTVEHEWGKDEQGNAHDDMRETPWDEVVLTLAEPIMKDVIATYTCNDLHELRSDPRVDIVAAFKQQLQDMVEPLGFEMTGGGISNIKVPDKVFEQRIENWRVKWEREIEVQLGYAKASSIRAIEAARMETRLKLIEKLTDTLEEVSTLPEEVLTYRLIEAIGALPGEDTDTSQQTDGESEQWHTDRIGQVIESYIVGSRRQDLADQAQQD